VAQFAASYNGLSLGAGSIFPSITQLVGLNDLPPVRTADESRAGDEGFFAGTDHLGERTVTLGFYVVGSSQADYDAKVDQVAAAFALQSAERPFVYTLGDSTVTRQVNCRPRRRVIPRDPKRWGMTGIATVELVATDPRLYANTQTVLSTGLAAVSGGMTFPATFPLSFGATGGGGTVIATNVGNFQTPVTYTIQGPVVNPIVDNITTGQSLIFVITLASTDTLVISNAGTSVCSIVLNGTASRRNALQVGSTPLAQFGLPGGPAAQCVPNTSQTFRFRNNGAFAGGTLQISFNSAWI
jgi:hypothetical protein